MPIERCFRTTVLLLSILALAPAGCSSNDNNLGIDGADGGAFVCHEGGKDYRPGQTVTLSACTSCVCQADGKLGMCTGACTPDAATPADANVTCEWNGRTYQVGESAALTTNTSCVCEATGQFGMCIGASPPDAGTKADTKATCEWNGGAYQVGETVVLSSCTTCVCLATGQLGMCTGACSPDAGPRSDASATCQQDGVTYQVGQTVRLSACTTCVCLSDGTVGRCTGACPVDSGTDNPLCSSTGGQVSTATCCSSASDFPDLCVIGACSCGPSSGHAIKICSCPAGQCFDPTQGCVLQK